MVSREINMNEQNTPTEKDYKIRSVGWAWLGWVSEFHIIMQ